MQGLETQAAAEVCKGSEPLCSAGLDKADGSHYGGAVRQGQAFFRSKRNGFEAGPRRASAETHDFALKFGLAHADERAGKMSERCEIAAGTETSLLRNHRMDSAIETLEDQVERLGANARRIRVQAYWPGSA